VLECWVGAEAMYLTISSTVTASTAAVASAEGKETLPASTKTNTNADANNTPGAAVGILQRMMKLGRRVRNKASHTVNMYYLATTAVEHAAGWIRERSWLDAVQNACCRLVSVMAATIQIDQVCSKDVLMELAESIKPALDSLAGTAGYGHELKRLCQRKSIEKITYASGRTRTSKVGYAEYAAFNITDYAGTGAGAGAGAGASQSQAATSRSTGAHQEHNFASASSSSTSSSVVQQITGDGVPRAASSITGVGAVGGLMGSSSTGGSIIAWNHMRKSREDTFIIAARAVSQETGHLAQHLMSHPRDVACANALYASALRHIDPFQVNSSVETQIPLGRLLLAAPHSASAVVALLAGHDLAWQRKHSLAIEKYLTAYCVDPTQPLTALCIGIILISLSACFLHCF
jgi:hypothetical protein